MSEVYLLEPSGVGALVNFQEGDAPPINADVPRELREAEVLRPGTYTDMAGQRVTFTVADLHEYARNFDPADPPPIQLDHSKSARDTQGYVRAVRMDGDKLRALLEFRGQEAVTRVSDGLWRKLSAGVYLRPQKRLKEVSVTPFPAVAGPEPARVLTQGGNDMDEQTPAPVEDIAPETVPEASAEPAEVPIEEPVQEPEKALADTSEADAIMAAHAGHALSGQPGRPRPLAHAGRMLAGLPCLRRSGGGRVLALERSWDGGKGPQGRAPP